MLRAYKYLRRMCVYYVIIFACVPRVGRSLVFLMPLEYALAHI